MASATTTCATETMVFKGGSFRVRVVAGPVWASDALAPKAAQAKRRGGSRDFVLHYQLARGAMQSGLMRDLIGHLRPIDTFNMTLFSSGSTQLAPARCRQRKRTCGVPSRYWKGRRVAMEMEHKPGTSRSFVVADEREAASTAERFRESVSAPILSDIRVDFDGFRAYDIVPASVSARRLRSNCHDALGRRAAAVRAPMRRARGLRRGPVHRATHSLSVEDSMRMRALSRFPSHFAKLSRSVRSRRSMSCPVSVRMQTWLAFLCTSIPIWSMAGLHCRD